MTIITNDIVLCKNNIFENVLAFQNNECRHLNGSPCSKISVYSNDTYLLLRKIFTHFDLLGNILITCTC